MLRNHFRDEEILLELELHVHRFSTDLKLYFWFVFETSQRQVSFIYEN